MTSKKRLILSYGILALLLAVLFAANLFWGSVSLTPGAVLAALTGRGQDALSVGIITQLRLPRAVMVVLLGAALSAAGYLLQTFFANPIAGPFVMGISSGAKLAVALVMVAFLNHGLLTSSLTLITAAFAGAMASMAFVLAVSRRVQRMSILVICGVMIGYICSAVTEFVVAFAQDSNIVNLHNWSQGSFSGMTWGNVRAAALVVLPYVQVHKAAPTPGLKPYDDAQLRGREVYIANGCVYCHTQQPRPKGFAPDFDRGWGRATVAGDYAYDAPHLLGTMRTGPDLMNIGARQPSEQWHLGHLYQPRAYVPAASCRPTPICSS